MIAAWRRRRRADLKARVDAAAEAHRQSRQRLEQIRRDVIEPIQAAGRRNHFADLIRASLREGYR